MQTITKTNDAGRMRATWYLPLTDASPGQKYDAIKMTLSYSDGGYSSRKGIQISINRVTVEPCNGYSMESNMLGNGARVYIKTLSRKSQKAYNDAYTFFENKADAIIMAIANANPSNDCYAMDDVYREQLQPLVGILD
jgi:hypothetical protein